MPKYYINKDMIEEATFTKQEFLDSIQKRLSSEEVARQKKKINNGYIFFKIMITY